MWNICHIGEMDKETPIKHNQVAPSQAAWSVSASGDTWTNFSLADKNLIERFRTGNGKSRIYFKVWTKRKCVDGLLIDLGLFDSVMAVLEERPDLYRNIRDGEEITLGGFVFTIAQIQ